MTLTGASEHPPTHKQLTYLRSLASRSGQTFAYPRTSHQASQQIRRLQAAEPSAQMERYLERKQIADQIARGPEDASRVRAGEIAGWGSSATWKERS